MTPVISGDVDCPPVSTFWTTAKPINFSWEFCVGILMFYEENFSAHVKKMLFIDFAW